MSEADTYELLSAEENEEYSKNLSYPVYIVTYTAGENEDTREWTVFAMDTDVCTYLYGFCALPDAAGRVLYSELGTQCRSPAPARRTSITLCGSRSTGHSVTENSLRASGALWYSLGLRPVLFLKSLAK